MKTRLSAKKSISSQATFPARMGEGKVATADVLLLEQSRGPAPRTDPKVNLGEKL